MGQVDPFFDFSLSVPEIFLIVTVVILSMAMQCTPVLRSPLAIPLIFVIAALCWLSPFTGFFCIACMQSLPYPEGASYNPAQIGALTWLPVSLIRYRRIRLRGVHLLWTFVPFLLWFALLKWENVFDPRSSEYVKALIYAVIACQMANEARGRYLKCLLGLCIGALMVTNAYWGEVLGLPIELSEWGGAREGFTRLGGTRADSIMVWPPTFLGAYGVVGLAFTASIFSPKTQATALRRFAGLLFLISIPPLAATMSNAAYLGWSLMIVWTVALVLYLRRKGLLPVHIRRGIAAVTIFCILLGGIGYTANILKLRNRMEALWKNYERQRLEEGFAASRTDVWTYSIRTVARHPLSGLAFASEPEQCPPGYPQGYFSHNVFLDYSRWCGLPGSIMLACFFFFPFVRLWRRRMFARHMSFFLAYFSMFLFWMVLSFQFYKTFWGLWMLMAMTAFYDHPLPSVAQPSAAPTSAPRPRRTRR